MQGAALGTVRNGRVNVGAAGVASSPPGAPVTPDTVFQLGSITKPMLATMAMMLVDRRKLDLDKPVRQYLPEFRPATDGGTITARHLLAHTSGLDGDFLPRNAKAGCLEYVEALADARSLHAAGRAFSYCNAGYVVLAALLESITGRRWDQLLRERLFAPLDMASASIVKTEVPDAFAPAGAVAGNVADLLKFVQMHLAAGVNAGGHRILSAASVAAMRRRHVRLPTHAPARSVGWGLGWCLYDWDGNAVFGHDGDTISQFSFLRACKARRAAAAVLTSGGSDSALANVLFDGLFAGSARKQPRRARTPRGRRPNHGRYVGRYVRSGRTLDVSVERGELQLRLEWAPEEGPHPPETFHLQPAGRDVFVGRSPAREIHFTFDRFDERGAGSIFSGYRLAIRDPGAPS